ncbi:transmembrane protease serine 9-like [Osmia bicornis bicornis]|uniref:transmembrane protease serine 9-like n=1 Tax=Osmia bicornis bicornis TaxID=1437191 RepID=UPI001EAEC5B8|nr:transmembrane protease serine 9-like [Osmia bicornis bicornis]
MWRLLVLLLASWYAYSYSLEPRIIGGENTTIDKYPYQVSVQVGGKHACGGSIISENFVLTAAHCVYNELFQDVTIRVKSTYSEKGGELIGGVKFMWPPPFNKNTLDYDIALLKLPKPITNVKPIKLADASTVVPDGSKAMVTGWGRLVPGGGMSSTLQVATVPTINWAECKKKYANLKPGVTERMMCASSLNGDMNVCQGDSGGPLVFNGVQIGIVSWGDGCTNRGNYGVYTRVSSLNNWIQKTMKEIYSDNWEKQNKRYLYRITLRRIKNQRAKSILVINDIYIRCVLICEIPWENFQLFVTNFFFYIECDFSIRHLVGTIPKPCFFLPSRSSTGHEFVLVTTVAGTTIEKKKKKFNLIVDEGRIVGGQPASIDEHPYQVSLRFNNRHICGGAIISEEWVITAAHCVQTKFIRFVSIKAGTSDLRDDGIVIFAKQIISHDNYMRRNADYDIALVRLEKPLVYSSWVRPILLAPIADHYIAGSKAVVTGWGVLRSDGPLTDQLRKVEVPLVSNSECSELYVTRPITSRMICAGYVNLGGKDACQGDSGGPLVQYDKLIGIVSWGFGCARPTYPGVYTSITALRSWITEKTGF